MNGLSITGLDLITAVAAFVGMILGIYNFFIERNNSKVKLKIIPKSAKPFGTTDDGKIAIKSSSNEFNIEGQPDELLLDIINLSHFPVTICEVGLHAPDRLNRFAVPKPRLLDDKEWPFLLNPRQRVTVGIDWENLLDKEGIQKITSAYAKTVCGNTCFGMSNALKALITQIS